MCTLAAGKWLHLLFLPLIWDPQKCRKLALIVNDDLERESRYYLELVFLNLNDPKISQTFVEK